MTAMPQTASGRNRQHATIDFDLVIVAEWPINKRGETARVSIEPYKGSPLVNIRKWFEDDDGEMRPSKGIALNVKHLPQLAEAVAKALTLARERGLIADDHEGDK